MKNFKITFLYLTLILGVLFSCSKDDEPVDENIDTVTDIDGNVYNTVTIGTQTWMVENLRVTHYNDGTPIQLITDADEWVELPRPAYCWYDNDSSKYSVPYGALYNWYAVNTGKLCPSGWHVPSKEEWQTLVDFIGGTSEAGGKLKEIGFDHWETPNEGATNAYGFYALPSGNRSYSNGQYNQLGETGDWWTSTTRSGMTDIYGDNVSELFTVYYELPFVDFQQESKRWGFSVRCIKD